MSELTDSVIFVKPYGFKNTVSSLVNRLPKKSENWQLNPFYFILLDSPIIGRVTATAWRQLLRARNSPSPHER